MTERQKYFYLLSLSKNQLPTELNEFGIEQIVVSSDGFHSDIETMGALTETINNLNASNVAYKFNSTDYPVKDDDQFEDNSFIELGENFVKLLILATDDETVTTSDLIGKVFSILSYDEYAAGKDNLKRISSHVVH